MATLEQCGHQSGFTPQRRCADDCHRCVESNWSASKKSRSSSGSRCAWLRFTYWVSWLAKCSRQRGASTSTGCATCTAAGPAVPPFPSTTCPTRRALTQERAKDRRRPGTRNIVVCAVLVPRRCVVPIWNLTPRKPWKPPAEPRGDRPGTFFSPAGVVRHQPCASATAWRGRPSFPLRVRALRVTVEYCAGAVSGGIPRGAELDTRFVTRLSLRSPPHPHPRGHLWRDPVHSQGRGAVRTSSTACSIFLIFWTQPHQRSHRRLEYLRRLQTRRHCAGIRAFDVNRGLAAATRSLGKAGTQVLVRYMRAHRKAETEVFPVAREHGTSILTFNNTCYGRLLDPSFEADRLLPVHAEHARRLLRASAPQRIDR